MEGKFPTFEIGWICCVGMLTVSSNLYREERQSLHRDGFEAAVDDARDLVDRQTGLRYTRRQHHLPKPARSGLEDLPLLAGGEIAVAGMRDPPMTHSVTTHSWPLRVRALALRSTSVALQASTVSSLGRKARMSPRRVELWMRITV